MSKAEDAAKGNQRRLGFPNVPPLPRLPDPDYQWRLKTETVSATGDVCNNAWPWEESESVSRVFTIEISNLFPVIQRLRRNLFFFPFFFFF